MHVYIHFIKCVHGTYYFIMLLHLYFWFKPKGMSPAEVMLTDAIYPFLKLIFQMPEFNDY